MPHALWGRHVSIQRAPTHVRRMCPTVAVDTISTKRGPAVLVGILHVCIHSNTFLKFDCLFPAHPFSSLEGRIGHHSEDVLPVHPPHRPSPRHRPLLSCLHCYSNTLVLLALASVCPVFLGYLAIAYRWPRTDAHNSVLLNWSQLIWMT